MSLGGIAVLDTKKDPLNLDACCSMLSLMLSIFSLILPNQDILVVVFWGF